MGPVLKPRHHTSLLIWLTAILCSILAVAVIITGLIIIIAYLVIKPKVPRITVTNAGLDGVYFDQSNLLTLRIGAVLRAENHNAHAEAVFSNTYFLLTHNGRKIAVLKSGEFGVDPNGSRELNYVVETDAIPLSPNDAEELSRMLESPHGVMAFEVVGRTKTRWRVWVVGWAKFWLHLDCGLILPVNGTRVYPKNCTSRYE